MRDPLHWMSVKHKLSLAFAGLCLLAFGVGGFLISQSARDALEEQIQARVDLQCRASARALDDGLRSLRKRTEDFASDGLIRELFAELLAAPDERQHEAARERLADHLRRNKLPLVSAFVGLSLVAPGGVVLVHVDDGRTPVAPAVVTEALAVDGPRHSNLLPHALDGAPLQAISTPLRSLHGGESMGHLIAWVDPAEWVASALAGLQPGDDPAAPHAASIALRIVDREGNALVPGDGLTLRVESESPPPTESAFEAAFRPRRIPVSENGWEVRVRLDNRDAFAAVSGLQSRFLGVGVVLAALCALLLFFPMRFLVRPLAELRHAARRIREGDYAVRVEVDSADEVGDLARSFNHMADAVAQHIDRLARAAGDLRDGQRRLREQHERLDTVIRTLRDGLVVLDADGRPLLSNAAARPLLDILARGDERLSSHYVCRQGEATRACAQCLLDRDEPESSCVLDVAGRVFEIHVTRLPPGPDGRRGRVLLARDVTERLARDERDIHRERLSVLGEVAAVMAHELNNPLTSIRMFAQMLADDLPPDAAHREHVDVILRNAETCRHSIRELLGYATDSAPEAGPVDVHAVLEDVAHFVRPLAERARCVLELRLDAEDDVVTGDEIQIRQLFVNLVVNAVQAASGAGEHGVVVTLATRNTEDALVVDVIDSGPGLDAQARGRAFDAFFSTKPRGEGTGLGLPTARRIAELHGGGLELVESRQGRTVFRARLRRASRALPVAKELPA